MNTPDEHDAPVDMDWLRECSDNDAETMTSLLTLFLTRTAQMIDELDGALAANSAADVRRISHACAGSSGACGMVTLAPLFKELERMGAGNNLSDAAGRARLVRSEFERVKVFVKNNGLA